MFVEPFSCTVFLISSSIFSSAHCVFKTIIFRDLLGGPMVQTVVPLQGAQVWSLVGNSVSTCHAVWPKVILIRILNSLPGNLLISISLGLVTRKLLCSFDSDSQYFFDFFLLFLKVLHCCIHIWRSHFFHHLLTDFRREYLHLLVQLRNFEIFKDFSYGYAQSILCASS